MRNKTELELEKEKVLNKLRILPMAAMFFVMDSTGYSYTEVNAILKTTNNEQEFEIIKDQLNEYLYNTKESFGISVVPTKKEVNRNKMLNIKNK